MSTTQEIPAPTPTATITTTPTIEATPSTEETVTIAATQSGVTEEPSVKLKNEVENWSSYVKGLTKLSWDSCEKEPSNSSDLKMTMATVPVSTKEINGVKLAITPKISFTSSDIKEFVVCEAGAYRPIYVSKDYILWISPCSTGMEPDNPLCFDSLSKIEKLYQ